MKSLAFNCNSKRLAIATIISFALVGCDGGTGLTLTDPASSDTAIDTAPAVIGTATSISLDTVLDDIVLDDEPVDEPVQNTVTSQDTVTDNDASAGMVAADYLADRAALGAIKIMAVGDSITHGVAGVSSYRKEFTERLEAASCSFTMVGSQTTSISHGRNPECEDTGVIGDGWGWNGTSSCLVGVNSSTDVYTGAHEGYSAHRADHFLNGHVSSSGDNAGIRVAMETYTPDVVLLHVGSVDLYNQQGVGNALSDIEDVLNAIYETQPETLVLIANLIPWYSANPYPTIGDDIALIGDGIEEMVAERYDPLLKLVDVRSGYTESMMLNDAIHPNAAGEAHIADAFLSVYQPLANCAVAAQ